MEGVDVALGSIDCQSEEVADAADVASGADGRCHRGRSAVDPKPTVMDIGGEQSAKLLRTQTVEDQDPRFSELVCLTL